MGILGRVGFTSDFESGSCSEDPACRRDLASENGYVIDEARALLIAARKNVAWAVGLLLRLRGRRSRFKVSKKKNVRDGLRVSTRDAEYPDQNPCKPRSLYNFSAIEDTDV